MDRFTVGVRVRVNEQTYMRNFVGYVGTVCEPTRQDNYVRVKLDGDSLVYKFRETSLDLVEREADCEDAHAGGNTT